MPRGTEAKVPSEEDVSLVLPGDRKRKQIKRNRDCLWEGQLVAWDSLRAIGGDSPLERGRSSAGSHPEPYSSGLHQGQVLGAGERRSAGKEEFSAHELSVPFSSVGKIRPARVQSLGMGQM